MFIPHSLSLYLLLLLDTASATGFSIANDIGDRNFVSRAVHNAHRVAARHSKGFANDLRVALSAVLVPPQKRPTGSVLWRRDQAVLRQNVVYCKSGGSRSAAGNGKQDGHGTSTGSDGSGSRGHATISNSTARSGPTQTGGGGGGRPTTTSTTVTDPTETPISSPFRLLSSSAGNDFFNGWNFFTGGDPTSGSVDYIDEGTGRSNGLVEVNSAGNAIMRVETTPEVSGNRKSIRITTQLELDKGLWILDAVHMPSGCGTWPAFWTNGPSWPFDGEFDILEGVHDYTNNQATLHTGPGCTLSPTTGFDGTVVTTTNCEVSGASNSGCGIRSSSSTSYGAGFNNVGGGVYAGLIDSDGATVWFWPRASIPEDILAETPLPSSWGTPMARWSASTCNPDQIFRNQAAIFTNTLCGQWAGGVWNTAGVPGQDQSCAQRTGFSTCEEFVRKNGASFAQAYWEIKSVKIYERK